MECKQEELKIKKKLHEIQIAIINSKVKKK